MRTGALISGRYRLLDELGRGGAGAAYRVRDESSGRVVALKTLEHSDARLVRLFEREYHTLASLKHPRVIEVYDFGISAENQRFYTMELLAGDDLRTLAPLSYRQACAHLRDVAACLALLHARRLLHRDVSPRNIRLDAHGRAKLLDFGALGDFGLASEIAGTPPYMPAEAVRRVPLDQRSDLFSLGATLYFALTKHTPFAVRSLEEIEPAQRTAPVPPSTLAPNIPEALDELVLSLLRVDPMQRPSSAAEVMDRLAAIGGLDAEPLTGLAESHFLSSALIGRAREKEQLRQHAVRALRGEGSVVIIEGASGMGRTRLASELSIDARIAGMTSLRIDAPAHPEPAGTLRALARALLDVSPQEALAALPKYARVLGHAFPELRERTNRDDTMVRLPKEAAERRALVQRTFVEWLVEVCEARPLLLVVDDAHQVDADSAGALVLIAHAAPRARLVLAVTLELDTPAPTQVQQLTRIAARLRLRSLDREDIDKLIASVFGDVPHRARLAQWLLAVASANPGHSLVLLQHLVNQGVIRYVGGVWALPASLPEQELPAGLDESLHAQVRTLGSDANQLARMFALHVGTLGLQACLQLTPSVGAAQIVAALDQLVAHDILVRSEGAYRFGREALRGVVLRDVSPEGLTPLHAALARAVMKSRPELFEAVEAGKTAELSTQDLGVLLQTSTHLQRGGDGSRANRVMRDVAVELTMRGDGLSDAVPALEAAVLDCRAHKGHIAELAPLLIPLTLAGTYSDFRLSYRYGDETLDILLDGSGLAWSRRMQRFVGRRAALWLGLIGGFLRFQLFWRPIVRNSFRELILGLLGVGTALLGTASVLLDKEQATRVAARLDILRLFPQQHAVRHVRSLQEALLEITFGDVTRACEKAMRTFVALSDEHQARGIRDEARLQLQVGCLTPVSLAYGLRVDGKVHQVFDALDQLRTSVSRQIAAGGRAAYHGHRGERAKFLAYHDEMDVLACQAGSTWREDVGAPRQMWTTYVLCEDVLGLKRAAHDLDAFADELPSLRKLRDATRASYLCERGMHHEALRDYRGVFEQAVLDPGLQGVRFAGAYARILRVCGEPARAQHICERALARLNPADREFRVATFGAELELLLSIAALGALDEAAAKLELLIDAQRGHDNPLLHGLAHKARAQVALQQRDLSVLVHHMREMESWFSRTENPALIAQCQRLAEQAKRAGLLHMPTAPAREQNKNTLELTQIRVALEACRGPAERLRAAIDLVLAKTGAERGYLYLLELGGLRFAAPLLGDEPPESLSKALQAAVDEVLRRPSAFSPGEAFDVTVDDGDEARSRTSYAAMLLTLRRDQDLIVVGAIALIAVSLRPVTAEKSFVEAVARAIYAAGDVRSVYLDVPTAHVTVRARHSS